MSIKPTEEFILSLYESLLRAQLNTVKQVRKSLGLEAHEEPKKERISQMDMVYDVLSKSKGAMHVDDIISQIEQRFGFKPDKDSLVSALTKRIARHDRFIKTGPNTFSLIAEESAGGQR
jgi:hypothetical protein